MTQNQTRRKPIIMDVPVCVFLGDLTKSQHSAKVLGWHLMPIMAMQRKDKIHYSL